MGATVAGTGSAGAAGAAGAGVAARFAGAAGSASFGITWLRSAGFGACEAWMDSGAPGDGVGGRFSERSLGLGGDAADADASARIGGGFEGSGLAPAEVAG